jgi:4-amino-4-deoxy-L-arabinose transferase-like glycosyltransferase
MKKILKKTWQFLLSNKSLVILIVIFAFELFLRFYQMDLKNPFGYDQVDNAWAVKKIIVDHIFPLVGMVAKGNSSIYIGPVYYYMIAIVYWIFNLNPLASAVFAGLTSIFTFWVIFYVAKKMFSMEVALFAVFINTFFLPAILFDRVQWPVNFIPGISLLIFYVLYRIILEDVKKIIILALLVGFSFSIHFTSIFYPIIIVLSLPLFPRTKETIKYSLLALPLFLIWLAPNVVYQLQQKTGGSSIATYLQTYYHGFHLTRVKQLLGDALIEFNGYAFINQLVPLKFIALPAFFLAFLYKSIKREKLILCYLILLWFIVPWFVFATYSGEISDYYFAINKFIALLIIAYFFSRIWMIKNIIPKVIIVVVLLYVAVININAYLPFVDNSLLPREKSVIQIVNQNGWVAFRVGVPDSYLYYYYMRGRGIDPYGVKK